MTYLILAVLCSVAVSIFLKMARRQRIDMGQAIAMNYVMATAFTGAVLTPHLYALYSFTPPLPVCVALGR